jgi:23S rRNA (cytosine1962-C5)-methyltransferase
MSVTIPVLYLKPGRERSVSNRHPWLFSGALKHIPNLEDGTLVMVCASDGEALALGHFSTGKQIVCRMYAWGKDAEASETDIIKRNIQQAVDWRLKCIDAEQTTAYRLIHAEGDFLPGCIADRYQDTLVLQLRTAGMMRLKAFITEQLLQVPGIQHVLLRAEGDDNIKEAEVLAGDPGEEVEFTEHGFRFLAEIRQGQKTGFFLDQRENRALLRQYARQADVLNTFAYSGAFSVYALAGSAKSVTSVDISQRATDACVRNVEMNSPGDARHTALTADCFDFLKQMPQDAYDLIILDPPAFTKHISTVDKAARGYKEINLKAMRKIRKGGVLFTFSCSQHISADLFRKIIFGAAADAGRNIQVLHRLSQPEDHPVSIYHPEGEYLKGLVLRVLD